ncbi:enolase C-terminal domain-like protein [Aspergillus sergii]|uniref:Enolase C-terminal domain-like protein n=1 Tax=Aspergillus sergii TaxID=1034303 RepID=A0A5N6X3M1_9EURO|nr:enolase C-terminal domain-like protein [Aspergillus sergii]
MWINDITVFSYSVDYAYVTYTMSRSDYLPSSLTGELAALKDLGPVLLGLVPRSPVIVNAGMDHVMMSGMAAKAVLDVACWDILGKAMQLPTATLLGGRLADDLPAFSVIGVGDPITGVEKARGELEKGLTAMQLKVGDDPLRRVKAIREAMPDSIELWADANGGRNLDQALRFCRALGQDITVALEQPCRLLSDCGEVGQHTGLPIALDESIVTMADLVAAYVAGITGVNIKVSRVGGFTKARVLRDAAVALDMMVTIDDTGGCCFQSRPEALVSEAICTFHLLYVALPEPGLFIS